MSALTGNDTYFEDFEVGQKIRHARGTTIDEVENQLLTKLVMNTAQGHWNEDVMKNTPYRERLVFGFITASMVIGLATQDTGENTVRELGLDKIRFTKGVVHGNTVYAYTEVLEKGPVEGGAGMIRFQHWGVNQDGAVVFEGQRSVLIRSRAA